MLFTYAWLFFLFSSYVVAVNNGLPPIIHQAHDVVDPFAPGFRAGHITNRYMKYKGYWVLKNPPPNHLYSDMILHIWDGELRLYYVESGDVVPPVLKYHKTLSTREDKKGLVGVYTQIPTISSLRRDRFNELIIKPDEKAYHEISLERPRTAASQLHLQIPNPCHEVQDDDEIDGFWVLGDVASEHSGSGKTWYEILNIKNKVHTRFRLDDQFKKFTNLDMSKEKARGLYFRIPLLGMKAPSPRSQILILNIPQDSPAKIHIQ